MRCAEQRNFVGMKTILSAKYRLPLLIVGSLTLLAALETDWLRRTYAAQCDDLREQVEQTLKTTVLTMHAAKMQRRFAASREFDSLFFNIGAPMRPPQYLFEKKEGTHSIIKEKHAPNDRKDFEEPINFII